MDSKPREIRTGVNIDFNKEYEQHLRCPNCNRQANGIDDFRNIKTGRVVKTCIKCRKCVYKSVLKKPRPNRKPITNKERLATYKFLVGHIPADTLKNIRDNNPSYERIFNDLFKDDDSHSDSNSNDENQTHSDTATEI